MHPDDASTYQHGEAQSLRDLIERFEHDGFRGQFGALGGRRRALLHLSARTSPPTDMAVETIRRTEGSSDPDDMLAVLPLTCPHCATRGTLVLAYGPEASPEDTEVLAALQNRRSHQRPTPCSRSEIDRIRFGKVHVAAEMSFGAHPFG